MELRRRLRSRDTKQKELSSDEDTEIDTPANKSNTPKVESETPSCSRDLRPLEQMEIDSIANKIGSSEANKASETQTETQNDSKLLLKNVTGRNKCCHVSYIIPDYVETP